MENMLNQLLQQSDATKHINNDLLTTYHVSREENGQLRTEIHQLMHAIMDLTILPPPPLLTTVTDTSSTVEEMSLQLCGVQQDLQDVLDAVRHTMGKRKCAASTNHDIAELMCPTARRPTP
jgi:hypothetical protein